MGKIRVLVVDDHAVLRAGLRLLLNAQPDIEAVGEAGDGVEALRQCELLRPDVVLLDLSMPGIGGLEVLRRIRRAVPTAHVLVLSMHDDESYLREALRAGASGYTLKKAADTELISAIRAVARGEVFLHPSLTKVLVGDLLERGTGQEHHVESDYDALSEREREVLRLVALGHTSQQVADMLYLSLKTVETYKARAMAKLELKNRAELVRFALRHGLLDPDNPKHES